MNAMVFKHSNIPNAAKEYLRFMMEAEQYGPWLSNCLGYWCAAAEGLRQDGVLDSRSEAAAVCRDTWIRPFYDGYKGPITPASGAVTANYTAGPDVRLGGHRQRHAGSGGEAGGRSRPSATTRRLTRTLRRRHAARPCRRGTTRGEPWTQQSSRLDDPLRRQPDGWLARLFDYKPFLVVAVPAAGGRPAAGVPDLSAGPRHLAAFTDTTIGQPGQFHRARQLRLR